MTQGRKKPPTASKDTYLSDTDKALYGDRTPPGYTKLGFLGKGGAATVWLGMHKETGEKVAMKQFPKKGDTNSVKQELKIAEKIFDSGISEEEFPGLKSIAALLDETETKLDYWIIYELGGPCLTKNLFEVKGQFHKGERIYNVDHQPFYFALKSDTKILKQFIRKLLEVFDLLSCLDIVHADIKPDNILVDFDQDINTIKFIDFGSSFVFSDAKSVPATTPEYLPPEVLTFLENRGKGAMESSQ